MEGHLPDDYWLTEDFKELVLAIEKYCHERRGPVGQYQAARELADIILLTVTDVAVLFDDNIPAPVYVKNVIDAAVEAKNNKEVTIIWNHFFLEGGSYASLANKLGQSEKNARRRVVAFFHLVAEQLYEKYREIVYPERITPPLSTWRQRQTRVFQDTFGLTERQADVLLAFCLFPGLTRRQIIDRKLFIGMSTLQTHIRLIIKKMKVKRMPQAVAKALPHLIEQPDG